MFRDVFVENFVLLIYDLISLFYDCCLGRVNVSGNMDRIVGCFLLHET